MWMNDLHVFSEIVARGTFAEAARSLDMSPAMLTRRIAALEKRLGVRLLTRTPRVCRPTADGLLFYERAREIVDLIDSAENEIQARSSRPQGTLRMAVPLSFGRRRIAPLVAEFHALHPDVNVELDLTDVSDSLSDQEYDLILRIGMPTRGDYVARRVIAARRAVCASPAYLKTHGAPVTPDELATHECLTLVRDGRRIDHWMFEIDDVVRSVAVAGRLSSNSGEVIEAWALAGYGIALKSRWDVDDHIHAGRLVPLLDAHVRERADLFVVYPERRFMPARVRRFIDFMVDRLAQPAVESR